MPLSHVLSFWLTRPPELRPRLRFFFRGCFFGFLVGVGVCFVGLFGVLQNCNLVSWLAQGDLCNLCTHGVSTRAKKTLLCLASGHYFAHRAFCGCEQLTQLIKLDETSIYAKNNAFMLCEVLTPQAAAAGRN